MPTYLRILVVSLLLTACAMLSFIIPPMQSPDEHDHIKRACLLGRGVFLLESKQGQSSGGEVDSGLLAFMAAFPPRLPGMSEEKVLAAGKIVWTGERVFDSAPGTGYYLPLIYVPQTAALIIGEGFGLTIEHSYRLARLFALLATVALIYIGLGLYPASPLLIALLALPMSLFQFSCASIDGISLGLTVFSVAAFMRISECRQYTSTWLFISLTTAVLLLATSRLQASPMFALLFAACFSIRRWQFAVLATAALGFFLTWTLLSMTNTVDLRVANTRPPAEIAIYYLQHPLSLMDVLGATLADPSQKIMYLQSFLGVLGWLDAAFSGQLYTLIFLLLGTIGAFSLSLSSVENWWPQRLLLLVLSLASVALIFFALLVTWTPHPATVIMGVQGRYFIIPAVMAAYAIGGNKGVSEGLMRKASLVLCILLFAVSTTGTTSLLLERYYLISPEPGSG